MGSANRATMITMLLLASTAGCGPGADGGLALELRFGTLEQAQTGDGLPEDLAGLRVDITADDPGGPALASSGCIALGPDAAERRGLSLDLEPGAGRSVVASGWSNDDCSGQPGWRGVAPGVDVVAGQETTVELFVPPWGGQLVDLPAALPGPRAFASTTALPDGKLLLAGGFARAVQSGGAVELEAACDAWIFDPGAGRVERVLPMDACRGLHSALALADGRVLLAGGCSRARFDPRGAGRPMLRPQVDTLVAGAGLYDPQTDRITSAGSDLLLARSGAAAARLADGRVLLAGGRSAGVLRSDALLLGTPDEAGIDWQIAAQRLVAGRSGAGAAAGASGLWLVGGNAYDTAPVEWLDGQSLAAQAAAVDDPALALVGHAVRAHPTGALIAGGSTTAPGSPATAALELLAGDPAAPQRQSFNLAAARSLHASAWLGDPADGRLAIIGGLGADRTSRLDLELVTAGADGELLAAPLAAGAIGGAAARVPGGAVVILGGLDVDAEGLIEMAAGGRMLTP